MSVELATAIPADWGRDRTACSELVHDLIGRGEIEPTPDVLLVIDIYEKPNKFTPELARMLNERAEETAA